MGFSLRESGQSIVEYVLIIGLVSILALTVVLGLSDNLEGNYAGISGVLSKIRGMTGSGIGSGSGVGDGGVAGGVGGILGNLDDTDDYKDPEYYDPKDWDIKRGVYAYNIGDSSTGTVMSSIVYVGDSKEVRVPNVFYIEPVELDGVVTYKIVGVPDSEDNDYIRHEVRDMSGMFSMTEVEKVTSSVRPLRMDGLFHYSKSERVDLSGLDTSRVVVLRDLFKMSQVKEIDVSGWDTSNVRQFLGVFSDARKLEAIHGIDGFDFSSAVVATRMFQFCESITRLDLSSWDLKGVKDISAMFNFMSNLEYLDISSWDVRNVEQMNGMFIFCGMGSDSVTLKLGDNFRSDLIKMTYNDKTHKDIVEKLESL